MSNHKAPGTERLEIRIAAIAAATRMDEALVVALCKTGKAGRQTVADAVERALLLVERERLEAKADAA
jgi:hypothetical protein